MGRLVLDGRTALTGLRTGLGPALRVRATPGMIRRRLGPEDGGSAETWLAFRTLPGAVIQWTRASGNDGPLTDGGLDVGWEVPLPPDVGAPARPGAGAPRLEVETGDGRLVFLVDPPPERWRMEVRHRREGRALRVNARIPPSPAATLVVTSGPDAGAVARRLPHLGAEVRAREAASRPDRHDRLHLRLPNGEEGRALAWAVARLEALPVGFGFAGDRAPPREGAPGPGADSRWIHAGHGLLAAGLFERVRSLLASMAEEIPARDGDDGPPSTPSLPFLFAHLAGRYLRWSGARSLPEGARDAVGSIRDRLLRDDPEAGRAEVVVAAAAALRELADAAEEPGGKNADPRLRERADELIRGLDGGGPPTLSWSGVPLPTPSGTGPDTGDPDVAFRAWRSHLLAGIRDARGLWPAPGGASRRSPLDPAAVGLAVAALVFGLLGARADAAFGRLRLAPRIPGAWREFEVGGIRMGDVRVRLRYRRNGARHTFVLAPTAGRVPPNLVFEPLLPTEGVSRARVDGEPADLERYEQAGRTGVRLQLPLDSTREVSIDGDEHA